MIIQKPRMHVLRAQQFNAPKTLYSLFADTDRIISKLKEEDGARDLKKLLQGKIMYEIFYEPSTRTRFSFWAAGNMLGMDIGFTESAGEFSSAAKGETLEDTVRVLGGQNPQVMVIRHPETGAAERAAYIMDKYHHGKTSIVNAGDGKGQHPTQALLDVYTIWRKFHRLDNISVLIGGDLLNGRTCHSLAYILSKFDNVKLIFISPPELEMGEDIIAHLNEAKVEWRKETDLSKAIPCADVVYWTRVQKERLLDPSRFVEFRDAFHIGLEEMKLFKPDAILMHPLPRVGEISPEVDDLPQAAYFEQADNGQYIRAALLLHIFGIELE